MLPSTDAPVASTTDELFCKLEQQRTVNLAIHQELDQVRQHLVTSQNTFKAIYDLHPVGMMTLTRQGQIRNPNPSAVRIFGFPQEQLVHLPLTFLTQRQDVREVWKHLKECGKGRAAPVVTELSVQRKDHSTARLRLSSVALKEIGDGDLFLTAVVDLSERTRQEEALAETKEFAEAIVDTVSNPLVVLDSDLRVVSVNRAFTETFKRPALYIRGRVFEVLLNLWWSGNELRAALEKVLIKGHALERYRLEVELPDVGKRIFLLNARKLNQRRALPQRLLVSLQDVTEETLARERLQQLTQNLEQRVAARTERLQKSFEQMETFCYAIAHDLRAPLRALSGFSQPLTDRFARELELEGKEYATRIQQSANRMDRLIRDLLQFGQLNTIDLPLQDVDLEALWKEVLAQLEGDIADRGARIRKQGILPCVCGNRTALQIALTNLVANALKFVPPKVVPKIRIWSEDRHTHFRICIQDNGLGIEPEFHEKIFGVFQRLHNNDPRYPGTGIGLALVKKGIERLGGSVGVESQLGQGSRFWIDLPSKGAPALPPPTS